MAFILLAAMTILLVMQKSGKTLDQKSKSPHWIFLLPLLIFGDDMVNFARFNPVTDPAMLGYATDTGDFLKTTSPDRTISLEKPGLGIKSIISPNYNAVVGYREVQGADSLHLKRYHDIIGRLNMEARPELLAPFADPNTVRLVTVDHPLLNLLNVKYIIGEPSHDLRPYRLQLAHKFEMYIWTNPRVLGPARLVGSVKKYTGVDAFLRLLESSDYNPLTVAYSEERLPQLGGTGGEIYSYQLSPNRIKIVTNSNGTNLLVASEIAYPGWIATVDNQPAALYRADHLLRSVVVPNGKHTISMEYSPTTFRAGIFLTCTGMSFWIACLFISPVHPKMNSPCP